MYIYYFDRIIAKFGFLYIYIDHIGFVYIYLQYNQVVIIVTMYGKRS